MAFNRKSIFGNTSGKAGITDREHGQGRAADTTSRTQERKVSYIDRNYTIKRSYNTGAPHHFKILNQMKRQ